MSCRYRAGSPATPRPARRAEGTKAIASPAPRGSEPNAPRRGATTRLSQTRPCPHCIAFATPPRHRSSANRWTAGRAGPRGGRDLEQSLESSPSRALASWRSAVSNPSVNQPQIASSLRRAALRSPGRPDVVAVGTQRPDEAWPQRCADLHEMPGDLRIARGAIGTVLTWYDKGVPLVHRKQVEKRDRSVVLVHHTCRRSPRHDVTEDAARHSRFPTRQENRRT